MAPSAPHSIADTLPTLAQESAFCELLRSLGLGLSSPFAEMRLMAEELIFELIFERAASIAIEESPSVELGVIAPALSQEPGRSIPLQRLGTRASNRLRQLGIVTWGQLARMTPQDLLSLHGLGHKSAIEIVAVALRHSDDDGTLIAREVGRTPEAPPPPVEEDSPVPNKHPAQAAMATVARWATAMAGPEVTIQATIDLLQRRQLPPDVAASVGEALAAPLSALMPGTSGLKTAYDWLWLRAGDDRRRDILRSRLALDPPTLDELGRVHEVTRERVRQIEKRAREDVSNAFLQPAAAEVRWRAFELRQSLGVAIPYDLEETRDALRQATDYVSEDERPHAEAFLLWLAGPYRLNRETAWLELASLSPSVLTTDVVDDACDADGRVDVYALRATAATAGLVPVAADAWVARFALRELEGEFVRWTGSIVDKAATVLAMLGRPSTAEEINEKIGEGHSPRGLRNRLHEDARFVRTSRSSFGLRSWGLEEYTGIADEIEEEIVRQGGAAETNELVGILTARFELRESSVQAYTAVPRFVVDGGRIRIRRSDEPFVPSTVLVDEARAYLLDDSRCTFRVRIDDDLLRGSGKLLPQGVGSWLGVLPGGRLNFHFPDSQTLLISWPDSALMGPALGSLRRQVEALAGTNGDWLLLTFNRRTCDVTATLLREEEIANVEGWQQVVLLTGIAANDAVQLEQLLAEAVGAPDVTELRTRLRIRGEDELAQLIPSTAHAADLDEALDRIRGLL